MVAAVSQAPVIHLDKVRFRWQPQAEDILCVDDFKVFPGERVFIKGPSGSGKTTLLSLIAGVITPQHGSVTILDTVINTLRSAQRDRFRADHIGFIFQMFNLISYLSLIENITLPCRFSEQRRKKTLSRASDLAQEAQRLLKHLGLDVNAFSSTRSVAELSVGQQQRVAAARALIGSPELIIADEPTSALDSEVRQSFLDLLFKEVAATGTTLLFVSHDPALQPHFDRRIDLLTINQATAKA